MKKIALILNLSATLLTFSQQTTTSPYSGFGLGEIQFDQNIILSGMAGTSSAYVSEYGSEINFSNPAANRNLSFTTFNIGFGNVFSQEKTNTTNEKNSSSGISDISLGFPIGKKVKFGVGFQPFSSIDYKHSRQDSSTTTNLVTANIFKGNGGLNSLHTFVSYTINDNWSLGLRLNYLFGNIDKSHEVYASGTDLVDGYESNVNLKALLVTPGISYTQKIKENYLFNAGATAGFGTDVNSDIDYLHSTYNYNSSGNRFYVDTLQYTNYSNKNKIPARFSLGFSYGKSLNWSIGVDYKYSNANDFRLPNEKVIFKSSSRITAGGWIIPNINSYKSYLDRVTYRFGFFYDTGSLNINQTDIQNYAITLGTGLPIGKKGRLDPSLLNLSFELGKNGTLDNNLILENYLKFKIGFNLNDIWFRKYKFD